MCHGSISRPVCGCPAPIAQPHRYFLSRLQTHLGLTGVKVVPNYHEWPCYLYTLSGETMFAPRRASSSTLHLDFNGKVWYFLSLAHIPPHKTGLASLLWGCEPEATDWGIYQLSLVQGARAKKPGDWKKFFGWRLIGGAIAYPRSFLLSRMQAASALRACIPPSLTKDFTTRWSERQRNAKGKGAGLDLASVPASLLFSLLGQISPL